MRPVLATWLLFSLTVGLSLLTYFYSDHSSIVANMVNIMDVFMCWSLLVVLLITRDSNKPAFTTFDKSCLSFSGVIFVFWLFTQQHVLSNLLLQAIITIAYFPTIVNLWNASEHSESLGMWIIIWIATVLGLYSAIMEKNMLGTIYAARGLILIFILFILILKIQYKNKTKSIS